MAKRPRSEEGPGQDGNDHRPPSQSPFPPGEEDHAHTPKYVELEDTAVPQSAMTCLLPPHKPLPFANYTDYETHYKKAHTNRCSECRKNLPTCHFLELHIAELHDPLVAIRRDNGEKTFACFVEGCDKVCSDWTKRRSHLVDKHGFPKNYDFLVVNNGIDGRRSMLRSGIDAQGHRRSSRERRESNTTESTQSTEATSLCRDRGHEEMDSDPGVATPSRGIPNPTGSPKSAGGVDELTESMSSLKMVPRSITFGRRKGRSGLAKN